MNPIKNPFGVLLTASDLEKLNKAGYNNMTPIVKLFVGPLTWLLTGEEDGYFYGYGDLGQGCVEWGGLTNIEELPEVKFGPFWLEKDKWFVHKDGTDYLSLETLTGI